MGRIVTSPKQRSIPMARESTNRETAPHAYLANSHSYVLTAAANGERYRIDVAVPFGRAGGACLPVVYVLDGKRDVRDCRSSRPAADCRT